MASASLCVFAQEKVYQLPNSDFESDFVIAYQKGFLAKYYEPQGWHGYPTFDASVANAIGRDGEKLVSSNDVRPGTTGSKSVYIMCKEYIGIPANGVMTTGRIYSHSTKAEDAETNYNYSEPGYTYTDNGNKNSSFSQPFHGKPDAMEVWVKFDATTATQNSGYPYACVNAVIHSNARYQDPEATDYSTIKVAQAQNKEIANYNKWQKLTIPFDYDAKECKSDDPQYILVSFTTNAQPGEGTNGDKLYIDDISMLYYSDLSSLKVNGSEIDLTAIQQEGNTYNVTVIGKHCTEDCIKATPRSAHATSNISYDTANETATITVTANDGSTSIYNVHFVPAVSQVVNDYKNIITVNIQGLDSTITLNDIHITSNEANDNTADFTLNGFSFNSMNVGNIELKGVPLSWSGNDPALTYDGTITIEGPVTDQLNLRNLPIQMQAVVNEGKLSATLTITWNNSPISVKITPASFDYAISGGAVTATGTIDDTAFMIIANSIGENNVTLFDLSEATVSTEYIPMISEVWGNALVYLPEDASYTGENLIIGGQANNLSITDALEFAVPKSFTASAVRYDREFTITDGYVSTFILPFGFTVPEGVTVAELKEVRGDVLVFKPVEETVANKPYVVVTDKANFIDNYVTNANVEATTGADLTTTVGDYSHIGSYTTQTVQNAYGYQDGRFVYGNGTVNPFRTYIVKNGEVSPVKAFSVLIEDNAVTGIGSVATDTTGSSAIYNLQGVRVGNGSTQALPKGVYVVNGRKVIVK